MEKLEKIPLDAIFIPKNHIRVQSIDEKAIKKLSESILSAGLLVRIIVRPVGEVRAGGRRTPVPRLPVAL